MNPIMVLLVALSVRQSVSRLVHIYGSVTLTHTGMAAFMPQVVSLSKEVPALRIDVAVGVPALRRHR